MTNLNEMKKNKCSIDVMFELRKNKNSSTILDLIIIYVSTREDLKHR